MAIVFRAAGRMQLGRLFALFGLFRLAIAVVTAVVKKFGRNLMFKGDRHLEIISVLAKVES